MIRGNFQQVSTALNKQQMETHGQLLKKLIRRKKLTTTQAAEMLGFSRGKLNTLFNKERIDDIALEEIEKIFQVSPSYFPPPTIQKSILNPPAEQPANEPSCWQLLAEARQYIIDLQKQIIEMKTPNMNAPKRTQPA